MRDERPFEITFRVDGPDQADDSFARAFYEAFDGLATWRQGQLFLTVEGVGVNGEMVGRALVAQLETTLGVRVLEAQFDIVDIPVIAERLGRSRQNVHQIVAGTRRSGSSQPFPLPFDVLGEKRVWDWGTVVGWLKQADLVDEDEPSVLDRGELYALNHWLSRRRTLSATQILAAEFRETIPMEIGFSPSAELVWSAQIAVSTNVSSSFAPAGWAGMP